MLHDSAHGDHVTIRNDKRNVLRTPANNKIRLDDERGKKNISRCRRSMAARAS
ncbi:hypothetical protein LNP26_29245 [Klebsiella variicola subsp. variicola]|nr:hypothetical protein [Klebsiella variicola subsp. variicola]